MNFERLLAKLKELLMDAFAGKSRIREPVNYFLDVVVDRLPDRPTRLGNPLAHSLSQTIDAFAKRTYGATVTANNVKLLQITSEFVCGTFTVDHNEGLVIYFTDVKVGASAIIDLASGLMYPTVFNYSGTNKPAAPSRISALNRFHAITINH
ncbi:MAG: hypothetical protein JSS02_27350 [Planctomycetes bacterium]|nr:hypothetical protein [Planctomycetota bacterium]